MPVILHRLKDDLVHVTQNGGIMTNVQIICDSFPFYLIGFCILIYLVIRIFVYANIMVLEYQ